MPNETYAERRACPPTSGDVYGRSGREIHRKTPGRIPISRRRRSRKAAAISLPAPLVFWVVFVIAGATAALTISEADYVELTILGILLPLAALYVDDRRGFSLSKQMPRAGEARRNLAGPEILLLATVLIANLFVALLVVVGGF
jgi:hypothetical protein